MIYSKGSVIPQFVNSTPGCQFDFSDELATLYIRLSNEEIKNYTISGACSFGCIRISNCIFFCFNIGTLGWASCPYNPHLSDDYKIGIRYSEGTGVPLTILLISCEDGLLHEISMVGLGNEFSNALCTAADELYRSDFNIEDYRKVIDSVYDSFETDEELASVCPYSFIVG